MINTNYETKPEWIEKGYWIEPDLTTVKINQKNLDEYWYWIHERQSIWHKRVILGEPAPWTEDGILKEYKFTNAIRDLDRLTIYYIDNILSNLEATKTAGVISIGEIQKSVILNTMIYRLFCRIETWEEIGYIALNDWEEEWPKAKERLRKRREEGHSIFTSAYYVNDLKAGNPNPETNSNKLENAICLIEDWYKNIQDIYVNGFLEAGSMKEQLDYFKTLKCIGHFTAYEWSCDFCLAERYTGVKLVRWTDDSYTNVGPGAKRGLDWIFEDLGNMNHLQAIFYLRSIAKDEFKRLGYDKTMKWPVKVTDFNLRVIEHDLCEYQKYKKAKEGVGRPKVKFKQSTFDNSVLKGR